MWKVSTYPEDNENAKTMKDVFLESPKSSPPVKREIPWEIAEVEAD